MRSLIDILICLVVSSRSIPPYHTVKTVLQCGKTWLAVSCSSPHIKHRGSVIFPCLHKLIFFGSELLQTLHIKFHTSRIVLICHICFRSLGVTLLLGHLSWIDPRKFCHHNIIDWAYRVETMFCIYPNHSVWWTSETQLHSQDFLCSWPLSFSWTYHSDLRLDVIFKKTY